ncbi:MAG: phenylalanine 4-monooxygenase [Alphaproteobacteria bacterium]|nr:phenylalanine 4-monooxygenase [Alphaproteobacteria bacterium]
MEFSPTFTAHAGGARDLVVLDPDHPGFRDRAYRERRNEIARIALAHRTGHAVAEAPYSDEEHAVWQTIWRSLAPVHADRVCREILELQDVLPLGHERIPQLESLNPRLHAASGFRMEPVGGLVTARTFMRYLGNQTFLSTQYIRHHSKPFYTPEPDVVHELVGHAATLVHPAIAELNRLLGQAAHVASETEMTRIDRVYWYTMEFGLVAQDGRPKAFGAGLLSSVGELSEFATHATLEDWDLDEMARSPFDPTRYQDRLFVAPTFTRLLVDVSMWVRTGAWRDDEGRWGL